MSCLCQDITELKRRAAAMPTGELQSEIYRCLDLLDIASESMRYACQNASGTQAKEFQTDMLLVTLLVAVYVFELTKRPAVPFSVN